MFDQAAFFLRLARDVSRYIDAPPAADPVAIMRAQMENREANFVANVKRVIFDNPANPYHRLFAAAQCRFGDFADAVSRNGLESTLATLHRAGVWISHDEFKGRTPIVRPGGVEIHANPESFTNPFVESLVQTSSSGSTGKPTAVPKGLETRLYREGYEQLVHQEHGVGPDTAFAEMKAILPGSGHNSLLRRAKGGAKDLRWFTTAGPWRQTAHYRLATNALVWMARARGVSGMPHPTILTPGDFTPVARWLAERRRKGIPCALSAMVSPACRVAAAATDNGLDISGCSFFVGGEALSEAKRAVMLAAGVNPVGSYWVSEIGLIGRSCSHMTTGNRVHLFHDSMAVISHRRRAPLSDVLVDSLLFTTLLPVSPIVMINVEMDDSGTIAPARCNCLLSRHGFTTEICDIQSFGKLTGQGITLLGNDLVRILEQDLPARFGGRPGDFQLAEREGARQTELDLRVSPRVARAAAAPDAVREYFFSQIRARQGGPPAEWDLRQAEALTVRVEEPVATSTGKVHPLRLLPARTRAAAQQENPAHAS